jgi:hypothetical protein
LKIVKMLLEEDLRKEFFKKKKRGKGGASRPRPRFWPTGRSRLGPPALSPPPSPRPRSRPRADSARRGAVARRQGSAAAWRACGSEDAPRSATKAPRSRSPPPPLPFAPLSSLSPSLSRSRAALAAPPHAIAADGSELLSRPAPALSFPFATTTGSASSFRVACLRSSALGKPCVSARAHRSKSELRRPLGSRGSPSPLCLCLRS